MPPGKEKTNKRFAKRGSNPLGEDLQADRYASSKKVLANDDDISGLDADVTAGFVLPAHATQRILRTAKEQLETVTAEEAAAARQKQRNIRWARQLAALNGKPGGAEADDGNEEENKSSGGSDGDDEDGNAGFDRELRDALLHSNNNNEEAGGTSNRYFEDEDGEMVELEYDDTDTESIASEIPGDIGDDIMSGNPNIYGIDEEEARLLQKFRPTSHVQSRNLGDLIMERIREKEGDLSSQQQQQRMSMMMGGEGGAGGAGVGDDEERIDPRVVRVYTAIGTVLKRYTSGKIPKAFKILPNIKNWEQLLMLTKPDQWSPHATYQATKIFAANLNERMAQRFYAAVLLPIVHERMLEEKKLHPALYMAIRKALFKPVAFFKGFLLPLAMDEECTLREATVVASVLQRSHLPPVPTAVAIVKISQQPFSGPCSVFLRVLIDKKMALPYQAIDALVAYFHRFTRTHTREEPLPVLWHQSLLSFIQRYKNDFTVEQLKLLSELCDVHFHYLITAEARREINATIRARERGLPTVA